MNKRKYTCFGTCPRYPGGGPPTKAPSSSTTPPQTALFIPFTDHRSPDLVQHSVCGDPGHVKLPGQAQSG
ncbi:hypothetical protein ACFS07_14800 [Undibacterium arcticum]